MGMGIRYIGVLGMLTLLLSSCIIPSGPPLHRPKMNSWNEFQVDIGDKILHFSLPRGGGKPFEELNESRLDKDFHGYLGAAEWGWERGANSYGSIRFNLRIGRIDYTKIKNSENMSFRELFDKHAFIQIEPDGKTPTIDGQIGRFKDSIRFRSEGTIWMRLDSRIYWSGKIQGIDDNEVFIYPLNKDHYISIKFHVADSSEGNWKEQKWYAEAEEVVDRIMASITIDRGAEAETIEYETPYKGLVEPGTLRYFDDISVR